MLPSKASEEGAGPELKFGWGRVVGSVALGLVLVGAVLVFFENFCGDGNVCKAIRQEPPWLLLSGLAVGPAAILTWHHRATRRDAEIQNGRREVAARRAELENQSEQIENQRAQIENQKSEIANQTAQVEIARDAQFSSRYAQAVELLGSSSSYTRIGAIYALERVARDSAFDRLTVYEVLAALLRHGADASELEEVLQTAVDVLGRRSREDGDENLVLKNARLDNANFRGDWGGRAFSSASSPSLFGTR